MVERVAEFKISVSGDDVDIKSFLSSLRSDFKSAIADIEATAKRVTLFEGLEQKTKASADALTVAKESAAKLREELDKVEKSGGKASDELIKGQKSAQKEVEATTREYNRNVDALTKMQAQLTNAGVDTGNLAKEQIRLAEAQRQATIAATNQAAQQLLGLRTLRDTTPEVQRLHAAYNTLAASGTLSVKELAVAQTLLHEKVAEARAGVSSLTQDAVKGGPDLVRFFTGSLLPALGLTAGIAGLVAGFKAVVEAASEFELNLTRIGTVTNVSTEQLGALGEQAKAVARDVGIGTTDALKGLYELLRSGVPQENAIDVLRISATAAKAAVETLDVGVKASTALIDSYGLPVSELGAALDMVAVAAKNGGPTLKEFADSGGPLLVLAKAANIPFQELIATFGVLTDATGDAGLAATTLQQIIKKYDTAEAREKLHDLDIETGSLVKTFQQLAERKLPINEVLDLGLAGSKAAVGLLALTDNADALAPAMDRLGVATGENQKIADEYANTAKGRSDKLKAEWDVAQQNIGAAIGSGSALGTVATALLVNFNLLADGAGYLAKGGGEAGFSFKDLDAVLRGVPSSAEKATAAVTQTGEASKATAAQAAAAAQTLKEANQNLTAYATELNKLIGQQQANAARDIADINARAEAQIAALDRSAKAELATAAATLEIRTKQSADIFKVIADSEAKITAALQKEIEARTAAAGSNKAAQAKLAEDVTNLQLAAIAKSLTAYESLYKTLIGQEQAYAKEAEKTANDRLAFNESVEQKIFQRRIQGQSEYKQYLATISEIDRVTALAREALSKGEFDQAKKYADQVINLSLGIKAVVTENGAIVVNQQQALIFATDGARRGQDIYNRALQAQGDSAKTGSEETRKQIALVEGKLKELQGKYDELKQFVEAALKLKIDEKIGGIDEAKSKLDDLAKARTVTYTVKFLVDDDKNIFEFVDVPEPKASGGFVGAPPAAAQGFAAGGHVFRSPTWDKVPGSGNQDTVPARLSIGSFVMRKAASQHYGDGPMGMLARLFAGGGAVSKESSSSLLGRLLSGRQLGNAQLSGGSDESSGLRSRADSLFEGLADVLARNVRKNSTTGLNYSQYLRNVHALINDSLDRGDVTTAKGLFDMIDKIKESIEVAAKQANLYNVPLVYGTSAVFGEDFMLTHDQLVQLAKKKNLPLPGLSASLARREKERKEQGFPFAAGGPAGEIPAYLTPGEFVLKPKAVMNIARLFGGGMLQAMNNLKVPRGFFDGMRNLAPPRPLAFEHGGIVPGGPSIATHATNAEAPASLAVNFYGARITEQDLNTVVLPWFNRLVRRSR